MGLDVGFYDKSGDEVVSLRNHHQFTTMLFEEPAEVVAAPYSDFYVTSLAVESLLAKIESEMDEHGLEGTPRPCRHPETSEELLDDLPDSFCWDEPESWPEALPHYQLLLEGLLALIHREGTLICGWSA